MGRFLEDHQVVNGWQLRSLQAKAFPTNSLATVAVHGARNFFFAIKMPSRGNEREFFLYLIKKAGPEIFFAWENIA